MIDTNFTGKLTEDATKNFENIKKSVKGLYEVISIMRDTYSEAEEDDIYFDSAIDNVLGLYENFLGLMTNDYGMRQLMKKLRNSDLEIDIPVEDFIEEDSDTLNY